MINKAPEILAPIAYPVCVVLRYHDASAGDPPDGLMQIYHYATAVEAELAEQSFLGYADLLLSKRDRHLLEVSRPFQSGVIHREELDNLDSTGRNLRKQITAWNQSGGGIDLSMGGLFHGLSEEQAQSIISEARRTTDQLPNKLFPDDAHFIQAAKNLGLGIHILPD